MPLVDLPLSQLLEYRGQTPAPEDLKDFWKQTLQEQAAIAPEIELTPGDFPSRAVEAFHLWFTGLDGARIHAKYVRPKGLKSVPAILRFHGYTGNAGDWNDVLGFAAEGIAVASLDCRGQGGLSQDRTITNANTHRGHIIRGAEDGPEALYFRRVYADTVRLAEIVAGFDEVDPTRIGATGWSQGGGLTLACASLTPLINMAAPVYPFLCDFRRVWEMDLARDAYDEIRTWFRLRDPLHERETELWRTLSYIDAANLSAEITGTVLFSTGLMDPICPPSTQFAAFNNISSPKELVLYPDFGHEGLPKLHDRIHNFFLDL